MRITTRFGRTAAAAGALTLALAACGGGESLEGDSDSGDSASGDSSEGASGDSSGGESASADACEPGDGSLEGAEITVSSKDFDEQLILGNISKLLLEDAGASVTDEINLGGTNPNREALLADEVDHYWDYTGTAWISFFEEPDPIPDRVEQYEAVAERDAEENGLCWLEPSPFNNTYGIAYRTEAAEELGNPESLSDLQDLDDDQLSLCVESEFPNRNDGLPGMEETYGIEFPDSQVQVLDTGVVYQATDDGDPCNFGEIFTTDGRVAALDLTVLEDDESFFPLYNVAPIFQSEEFSEYGAALQELYAPVVEALDNETMTQLNARVSAEGERPAAVAQSFLEDEGFIGG